MHELRDGESRVALVVGGLGGIGRAICADLTGNGVRVVVVDVPEAVVASGEVFAGEAVIAGDIVGNVDAAVSETVTRFGRLDVAVNLVGMNIFADLLDLSDTDWQRIVDVNLTSVFKLSCAVAGYLRGAGRGGSIVHFTSVTSVFGSPGQAAYAAAKAAVASLVKSMAVEWAPYGIRVNAISPVMTRTGINAAWLDEDPERTRRIASRIPVGRLGKPEDYVGLVRFLTAPEESSFITWQTIFADGGTSLVHPLLGVRGGA